MDFNSIQSRKALKDQIKLEQFKGGKENKARSDLKGGSEIVKKDRRKCVHISHPRIATFKISTHWWTSQYFTNKGYQDRITRNTKKKAKQRKEKVLPFSSNALAWAAESGVRVEQEETKPIGEDDKARGLDNSWKGAYGQGKNSEIMRWNFIGLPYRLD